jgi:hypothetical protein
MTREGTDRCVPIPVCLARKIGDEYFKDCVVILAYDHRSKKTHATTWGRKALDKESAVHVRDACLEAIGADMNNPTIHEDYRFLEQGEWQACIDKLISACKAADYAIASVIATREGITDTALNNVRDAIKNAIGLRAVR